MATIVLISIGNTKDHKIQTSDKDAFEYIIGQALKCLENADLNSTLFACGKELECIHFSLYLRERMPGQIHLSHNLSVSIEGYQICNPSVLNEFGMSEECFIEAISEGRDKPMCSRPQEFINVFSKLFSTIIIVTSSSIAEMLPFNKICNMGRFVLMVPQESEILQGRDPSIIAKTTIETSQVLNTTSQVLNIPEQDNVAQSTLSMFGKEPAEMVTSGLESELSKIERNITQSEYLVQELSSSDIDKTQQTEIQMMEFSDSANRCLQKMQKLGEQTKHVVDIINQRLPIEAYNNGRDVQIFSCQFSHSKNLWKIKVYNSSQMHIRNVGIFVADDGSELIKFLLLEPQTSTTKYIDMEYNEELYFKHLIAKSHGKPVSALFSINPMEIKGIEEGNNKFVCKLRNRSKIHFQDLRLMCSSAVNELTAVRCPSHLKEAFVEVHQNLDAFNGAYIYLASQDNIVSDLLYV